MRPTDPAGFRAAWDLLERLWARHRRTGPRPADPQLLHESVDGEWSFIETLRHLVFATDAWIRRAMLGDPSPWDPLDLPWDEMAGHARACRATAPPGPRSTRCWRCAATGWPPCAGSSTASPTSRWTARPSRSRGRAGRSPVSYPVRECLSIVLNEEWEHRLYAERDLDALAARRA